MVTFQVFLDSAHQAQVERHQGHIKLDDKFPNHGAHVWPMTYTIKNEYHTLE